MDAKQENIGPTTVVSEGFSLEDQNETGEDDGYGDMEFIKHPKTEPEWEIDEYAELSPDSDAEQKPIGPVPSIHISQLNISTLEQAREVAEEILLVLEEDVFAHFPTIDISTLNISTPEQARDIAEEIILVLEQDVVDYFKSIGIDMAEIEKIDKKKKEEEGYALRDKISGSSLSISSQQSLVLPGDPSKLRLYYEKGENIHRKDIIPHLKGVGRDEQCAVVLHRSRKWKRRGKPEQVEGFSQTKAMAFIPEDKAGMVFMKIYPKPDDYIEPEESSRKKSMELALKQAEEAHKEEDSINRPKIISFSNRKKILPPLKDDYYKEETFWTGSKFRGEYKNRQFHKGHYDHPTGVTYESEWNDGHFHSKKHHGIMEYPRGDTFEGEWRNGRYVSGEITFGDGLKYCATNWSYLEPPDRRLRAEKYYGMRPAGDTIYNDQYPNGKIPAGCYDAGEGIYNPKNGEVRGYDGFLIRVANEKEHMWIVQHCRKSLTPEEEYIPTFHAERIPATYSEQIKRFTIAKRRYH